MSFLGRILDRLAVQIAVVIASNGLCLHLVVDAHISAHRLLVILKLRFDLLSSHHLCPLLDLLIRLSAILAVSKLVLYEECLLLLKEEVLHRLIVLANRALIGLTGTLGWLDCLRLLRGKHLTLVIEAVPNLLQLINFLDDLTHTKLNLLSLLLVVLFLRFLELGI